MSTQTQASRQRISDKINRALNKFTKGRNIPFQTIKQTGYVMTEKGLSASSIGLGSDPMVLYRPGNGKRIGADRAMDSYKGWASAAVRAISDEIANTEFRLFQIKPDGNHEEQFEHDILDLLSGVNDFQTGPEFKHMLAAHLELTGNAYILLLAANGMPVSDDTMIPVSMHLLNPAYVKVLLDKSTYPFRIMKYEFRIDGKKYMYDPYQILQVKYPDPSNPYEGIGTVQTIAEWIDNDNYAMEHNRKFFLNGARLGGLIESEAVTEEQLVSIRIGFESLHTGVENSHKIGVLPKGAKWVTTEANAKDMDFANLLDMTRDRILAGFRVSKTILGTAESDTNRATAETADYVFAKRTIKPKMQLIVSYLNEKLVPRFGDDIYLSFIDPTPEDKNFRIMEMQAVTGNQPTMSANEARENYLGLGPVEGGDIVKIGSMMVDLGAPQKQIGKPKKDMRKTLPRRKTQFARNAKIRREIGKEIAEKIAEQFKKIQSKTIDKMNDEEYQIFHSKTVSIIEESERDLKAIVEKFNASQEAEVLTNMDRLFAKKISARKKLADSDIFDAKKWTSILIDAATPTLTKLMDEQGERAAEALARPGIHVLEDIGVQDALDHAIELMSRNYNATTMALLKEKITEGLAENSGLAATSDLIKGIYAFNNQVKADMIAKTETFRISNAATKAAWKQIGTVKTVKWYTSNQDNVCPFCAAQNGKTVGIDDNFYDIGDTVTGKDGSTMEVSYDDIGNPPLHPNCNCYIRPDTISMSSAEAASIKSEEKEADEAIKEIENHER